MAKIQSLVMGEYQSDLGARYANFPFKIKAGFEDCADGYTIPASRNCLCSTSSLVSPRALVATFGDAVRADRACAKIRFPIPYNSPAVIRAAITMLKACGAVCIDLDGEEWSVVPPALGNYTPSFEPLILPTGGFSSKKSGKVGYNSDAFDTLQKVKVATEDAPAQGFPDLLALVTTIQNCHGEPDDKIVCLLSDIKARHAMVKGTVNTATGEPAKSFARKAPIASNLPEGIRECISLLGNHQSVQCVGYKGESIPRIDLLFA
jgi:hypothetical protein